MSGNNNGALEAGLNLLALLFGEDKAKPKKRPAVVAGPPRRTGAAGCNCTGSRVPPVRPPGKP